MYKWFKVTGILVLLSMFMVPQIGISGDNDKSSYTNAQIEKGEYLITIGGCHDCHTPKKFTDKGPRPDETRLLSGHPSDAKLEEFDPSLVAPGKFYLMNSHITAFAGPWGVTYAANLTPDDETGIGLWKEENFVQAMRTGKHMGSGRPILPPMPWFNLAEAKKDDLIAMFAYLKSIKPIKNRVPQPVSYKELTSK